MIDEQEQTGDLPSDAEASAADQALWNDVLADLEGKPAAGADEPPAEAGRSDDQQDAAAEDAGTDDQPEQGQDAPGDEAQERPAGRNRSDPWASAPPELKAEYDRLRDERHRIGQEYAQTRRLLGQTRQELEQLRAHPAAGSAPQQTQPASILDDDAIKAVQEEYPEVAAPFVKAIGALEAQLARISGSVAAQEQQQASAAISAELAEMERLHPGYERFLAEQGSRFVDWLGEQPRHIQEAAQRNGKTIVDAREAADVFDRFKQSLGMGGSRTANPAPNGGQSPSLSGKRQRQLQASHTPRSTGPSAASGIPEEGDPERMWAAVIADLERSNR